MKKFRLISLVAAIIMLLPMFAALVSADSSWALFEPFEGVTEPVLEGNLLSDGSFDEETCISRWTAKGQSIDHIQTQSGGYLRCYDIPNPTIAFKFKQDNKNPIGPGTYKFTGYFRTAYEGEVTELRFYVRDANHDAYGASMHYLYPTSNEWLKVEFYVVLDSDFTGITIAGGPYTEFIQSYCIDNFSLVKVDSLPAGYEVSTKDKPQSIGTKITPAQAQASNNGSAPSYGTWDEEEEAKYDVQGVIVNRDIDFIGSCSTASTSINEKMLKDYVYQYEGTHVTDFMINIYCQVAAYPSEAATDFIDQYYYNKENGETITSNQNMAYIMFERKDIDFIDIFCETFPEIGINPWLSYRMNDAHGVQDPETKKSMPFYYDNPQYRRFQHPSTVDKYYQNLLDYTHEGVRDHMLAIINESLSMYDCYGIELDFQRDIYIWHMGGEYAGLDILTDFMREVDGIVKIYEEKYGHEIKVALRCASDIQTNYDLGYDVITWAAEGLIDLVNPTARWHTTEYGVPVRLWTALMHPYGVEVAPGFESMTNTGPSKNDNVVQTFETMCAGSAAWLSQGADKVYTYNLFLGLSHTYAKAQRIVTGSNNLAIQSGAGHFNMLTTIGSYEKVVNRSRRMLMGYNDMRAPWKTENNQLPLRVNAKGTGALYMPLGDIPEGATVTFNFSANSSNLKDYPAVKINGQTAKYLGSYYSANGFTSDKILSYEVPAAALDDTYIIAEITPQKYLSVLYADLYVQVAE